MSEETLGVIGGGVMGEALLSRLIDRGIFPPSSILVSDPQPQRLSYLHETYGVATTSSNVTVVSHAQVLILAIKPQMLSSVAEGLAIVAPTHAPLLLSILAGVTLARLSSCFPGWAIIRAMPNTPATIGAGMTALAAGSEVTPRQWQQAGEIFASVGSVIDVPEALMDAVTAVSGSGPGYIALVVEALADGGVAAGLPRAMAMELALQTVKGTAQLLQQTNLHPGVLKDRVTSPGGTTIAGIAELEKAGLRAAMMAAVRAAHQRSKELGQN
jgi:pyrroline-5-carboxylate reductase